MTQHVHDIQQITITRLRPIPQRYPWGKIGAQSLVARLLGDGNYDHGQPYAELWMGAHPKAPSQIAVDGAWLNLNEVIARSGSVHLGTQAQSEGRLPFLFKVLSVNKPLSIQAHPSKELASILHQRDPQNYPDDNHKPEIAIAITPLELLHGFRSVSDISAMLQQYPEFSRVIPPRIINSLTDALSNDLRSPQALTVVQAIYEALLNSPSATYAASIDQLAERLRASTTKTERDIWFLKALALFGNTDIGLSAFYLLELRKINPGEALFTGPSLPHAYLSGDLVECMANSDNVVRAGLTDKFKDLKTMVSMLDYAPIERALILPTPLRGSPHVLTYWTPAEEFQIDTIKQASATIAVASAQIAICTAGSVIISERDTTIMLQRGEAIFVSAQTASYQISAEQGEIFIARCGVS
jgi:mannose-6-phosphate isomerase